jgi:hypothetical protein
MARIGRFWAKWSLPLVVTALLFLTIIVWFAVRR